MVKKILFGLADILGTIIIMVLPILMSAVQIKPGCVKTKVKRIPKKCVSVLCC